MANEFLLPLTLGIASLGSALLVGVSVLALFRRQSLSYFLVTLAIGTLLLRSFLGAVTLWGLVSAHAHHFLEHVLDALVIGLLFTAVYAARQFEPEPKTTDRYLGYDD
jgi:hypothetical protein